MTTEEIIEDIQGRLKEMAAANDFMWFYDLHQVEVVKSAEELLKSYPNADRDVVLFSAWLHDIVHYTAKTPAELWAVKERHHLDGATMAEKILVDHNVDQATTEKVKKCIERHRSRPSYVPESLEEKIVATADTLSHFTSIFYLTYFKFHPDDSLEDLVRNDLAKLERDWADLQMIPEAAKLSEEKYKMLKQMLSAYKAGAQ